MAKEIWKMDLTYGIKPYFDWPHRIQSLPIKSVIIAICNIHELQLNVLSKAFTDSFTPVHLAGISCPTPHPHTQNHAHSPYSQAGIPRSNTPCTV